MAEEIDYRTLTEVQLKYELKLLEQRILRITGDPLATGRGQRKWYRWASDGQSKSLSRPEDLPLETFILQRARDYFIDRIQLSEPGYALCPENRLGNILKLNPEAEQVPSKRFHYLYDTVEISTLEFYSRTVLKEARAA